MITKMKKLTFLVFYKDYEGFLESLRDTGVVHVVEKQQGGLVDDSLQEHIQLLGKYSSAIDELEPLCTGAAAKSAITAGTPLEAYASLLTEKESSKARVDELSKEASDLEPWGDFNYSTIARLGQNGWNVLFWHCPKKQWNPEWEETAGAFIISEEKSGVHFVTVTKGIPEIGAERVILPKQSPAVVRKELEDARARLDGFDEMLVSFANANIGALKTRRDALATQIDLSKVKLNTDSGCEDKLMLLEGWAPAKTIDKVKEGLDDSPCFYEISDPVPDDDIPVLMSNNKFFSLFEPFTKLYMLPTYGELDLTPFFAPFFMLFFGLCLGDMGYGLLMILAMPVFDKLFKLINPDFSKWLVPLFGGSTMLCGLLTGTAFGFSLYDLNIPFLQKMKDIFYQDNSTMFTLSLIIGAVQILFGMVLKAVNQTIQFGFKYALSTIGWIILLVTIAAAVLTGAGFSNIAVIVLLCISGVLIFLLNSPGKNPLLNIGLGLWDAYNMVTGLLGDVLSYVRLFALGLSGGILASVFNSLAVGMSPKVPVLGFLVTALIFVAGHGINIFMNFLGAIVHPMRLTFVEFFKNAGYTGSGTEYKPFANINNQ